MGWTFYHRAKGETNHEHFANKFNDRREIVASGTVDHTFYAAVRDIDTREVWAFIALTQWRPNDPYNFGYKDMSETCGPVEAKAPATVLDALTPTSNLYALAWRDECRHHLAQRKALRGLRDGDQVILGRPRRFNNGAVVDTFTIRRRPANGGRTAVTLTHDGGTYRLPRWQDGVIAIVRDGEHIPTPLGESSEETAYAHRVERLHRYGADDEVARALTERYGKDAMFTGLAYLARIEHREGRCWEWLETAERLRALATDDAA